MQTYVAHKIKTPPVSRGRSFHFPANAGGCYFLPDFFEVLFLEEEELFLELDFLVAFFIERFSLT